MPSESGIRGAAAGVLQLRKLQQRPWAAILRPCIQEVAAIIIQQWWRKRCLVLLSSALLGLRRVLRLLRRRAAIRIQQWWRRLHAN